MWVHCAGGMCAGIAASAGRDVVAVDDGFDSATITGPTLDRLRSPDTRSGHHLGGLKSRGTPIRQWLAGNRQEETPSMPWAP